jgi:Protein of unknown function (DUF2924)
MARGAFSNAQPASAPAKALDAELARIGAMNIDQLRAAWRKALASDPLPAFSKDLLARAIAFHAQQKALGGLSPATARLLRSLIMPGIEPPRQVKVGSVIVREHQGVVHEVLAVPGGFCWQGKTYDSLSTIAKTITGTSWNGPRFFGLRSKKMPDHGKNATTGLASADRDRKLQQPSHPKAPGRRSSVRTLSGDTGARL